MKNSILLLFLIFLTFNLSAKDWAYSNLSKLYLKNPEKCLERSKLLINYFPKKSTPYYFASKVSFDEIEKSKTTIGKYHKLNIAIKYANQYEKLAEDAHKKKVAWEEYWTQIEDQAKLIHSELLQEKQRNYAKALLKKIPSITMEQEEEVIDLADEKIDSPSESKENIVNNKMFFGIPSGTENIPSSNVQEEKELLVLINAERVKKGMKELVWEEDLARASRYHAMDLGTQHYFNHNSHDLVDGKLLQVGRTFERIGKFYTKSFVNSENLAAGNKEAADTYEQWYTSKGHFENMFNPSSGKVGIGMVHVPGSDYGYYWVFCTAY